jgi:hypothetical protein
MSPQAPRLLIGGDFELTQNSPGNLDKLIELTKGCAGSWTLSGRSALALVVQDLQRKGVKHIHLPAYLCDSIIAPIEALNLDYSFYNVDDALNGDPQPPRNAAVLLIDYFGWPNKSFSDDAILIVDRCQSFLSEWTVSTPDAQYVVSSPRKFGPTGVGGWCNLTGSSAEPTKESSRAVEQSWAARLLKGKYLADSTASLDDAIEQSYLASLADVENYLDSHPTQAGIPEVALKMIAGIDWAQVAKQRRENWLQLIQLLPAEVEAVFSSLPDDVVPLGLLVRLTNRDEVRKQLAAERIFCPVHWPLPQQVDPKAFPVSRKLADTLLTLPIDQRYGESEMTRLSEALRRAVGANS